MVHQDFNQDFNKVVFNSTVKNTDKKKSQEIQKNISQRESNLETTKIIPAKKLGILISQARTTKGLNQKQLSSQLCISVQILSRWESEKEIPNNLQISKIEKTLGIKLPRNTKSKTDYFN